MRSGRYISSAAAELRLLLPLQTSLSLPPGAAVAAAAAATTTTTALWVARRGNEGAEKKEKTE